mgnify:FL=1
MGIKDWLGSKKRPHLATFREFKSARSFAHKLDVWTKEEWFMYSKGQLDISPPIPDDIPKSPYTVYKNKGWKNWGDWTGKNLKLKQKNE